MGKIRIVTDSTADLTPEIAAQYGIAVVPLKVFFGRETFRDGIDLTPAGFYARQAANPALATTSQPSPAEFLAVYRPLAEAGNTIISLHISAGLSGTLQSAQVAANMLGYEDLTIIDSRGVSILLGMMVLNAARAAAAGKSKEEVLARIADIQNKSQVFFAIDTLEYLQRGGRIGKAQAFLGILLNIKPICTVKEGIIYPYEKVRGRSKAMDRLVQDIVEKMPPGTPLQCFLVHSNDPAGLKDLRERVEKNLPCREIMEFEMGPVVGTHAGPGLVGLVCYPEE